MLNQNSLDELTGVASAVEEETSWLELEYSTATGVEEDWGEVVSKAKVVNIVIVESTLGEEDEDEDVSTGIQGIVSGIEDLAKINK